MQKFLYKIFFVLRTPIPLLASLADSVWMAAFTQVLNQHVKCWPKSSQLHQTESSKLNINSVDAFILCPLTRGSAQKHPKTFSSDSLKSCWLQAPGRKSQPVLTLLRRETWDGSGNLWTALPGWSAPHFVEIETWEDAGPLWSWRHHSLATRTEVTQSESCSLY